VPVVRSVLRFHIVLQCCKSSNSVRCCELVACVTDTLLFIFYYHCITMLWELQVGFAGCGRSASGSGGRKEKGNVTKVGNVITIGGNVTGGKYNVVQ